MAFIAFPSGLEYPGLAALTGELPLNGAEQTLYLNAMRTLFILDGLFLLGWILSWVALGKLVHSRLPLFGLLTLIFGLAGALLDFSENSIIWGVIQNFASGAVQSNAWIVSWKAVQHLSYWLPFIGAVFAACALWSKNLLDKLTAITGTLLVIPAVMGLYLPAFAMFSNVWFLLWFAIVAVLLWRRSSEII
ncbi:MAG: hypothetical protein JEZ00_15475 [Anaerolineaceae bacterium]|nr:hypothetical protein [Anaerolineaceae bacterium]